MAPVTTADDICPNSGHSCRPLNAVLCVVCRQLVETARYTGHTTTLTAHRLPAGMVAIDGRVRQITEVEAMKPKWTVPQPTMTPEEVAAWEAMARDGTLGRWVKQEEAAWLEALQRRAAREAE